MTSVIKVPPDEDSHIQSPRLTLSPIVMEDAEPLFGVLKESALYSYTGGTPPSEVSALREHIRGWEARRSPQGDECWLNWTVRLKDNGNVIGHVQAV
jgi:hypothetical protein